MIRFLEFDEIIQINRKAILKYGGIFGILNEHLLRSAIANPMNLSYYQKANLHEIGICYMISIIKNHPFLDGNKRTGFAAMDIFFRINGMTINFPEKEIVEICVKIATNEMTVEEIKNWIVEINF